MQKLKFPLNIYIKAVEILIAQKGYSHVSYRFNKGSIVHFDLFLAGETTPTTMWTVHHEHNGKKYIISKEDYKKVTRQVHNTTLEEFEGILKSI